MKNDSAACETHEVRTLLKYAMDACYAMLLHIVVYSAVARVIVLGSA